MLKVQSFEDSSSNSIIQKPELASNKLKTFDPLNLDLHSSNVGKSNFGFSITLFKCCGSKQIRKEPLVLVTKTMELTQEVGSLTSTITRIDFILSSSSFNGLCRLNGTLLVGSIIG